MRQLIAGNWKMHGTSASLAEIEALALWVDETVPRADVLVCPPVTLITRAAGVAAGRIAIGAQDCSDKPSGAFTGDVSAEMLKDAGARTVIVGHSERRQYHGETDALVCAKAMAAARAGLSAIICIGESEAERDAGSAHAVVARQARESIPAEAHPSTISIAYEPIWAIGSGKTPGTDEIRDMHATIRDSLPASLKAARILYGGSVKPGNARAILAIPGVDGALVGGASLLAADFRSIVEQAAS